MSGLDRAVIVGGGQSAIRAIEAIRASNQTMSITLIVDEGVLPYSRPPLSKEFLRFEKEPSDLALTSHSWMQENQVSLVTDRASRIDAAAKRIYVGGRSLPFDRLLLATGSRPRELNIPGVRLRRVFYLRTLGDAKAIRTELTTARSVVVVGGGLIGLEVAASVVQLGCQATVIETAPRLLQRVAGADVGEFFRQLHESNGVRVVTGSSVQRIEGSETVEAIVTSCGKRIAADLVVIGIGVVPNVELAEEAGLNVQDGIVVDAACRTSASGIFAAGDVTFQPNAFLDQILRLETEQNAQEQGSAAGRNLSGDSVVHESKLWFWSNQFSSNFQSIGVPRCGDRLVVRGELSSGRFLVFYVRAGRIVAINAINMPGAVFQARRLMTSPQQISVDALADERIGLADLVRRCT